MAITVEATYENGIFKQITCLPLITEGKRVWLTLHIDAEEDAVKRSYGLMGWTGTHEELEQLLAEAEEDEDLS